MDLLQQLIILFAQNGYIAVFIALLLCGIGLPLPEDISLIAGGVISGLGYCDVHMMIIVAMLGVLLGDALMFLIGYYYGLRVFQSPPLARLVSPKRYQQVQQKFERYGNRLLFMARFLPGLRAVIYFTAGATHRVSFLRFLILDGVAALISVPIWIYLGFLGAHNRAWLAMWLQRGQTGLWLLGGGLIALSIFGLWRQQRREKNTNK